MPNILLVEDDDDLREAFATVLRDCLYEVHEAKNGLQAYEYLKLTNQLPCVILLDLMMPVMSGGELVMAISKDRRLSAIPIFLMSAYLDHHPPVAGVKKMFRKPVPLDQLLHAIAAYCSP